MMDAVCDGLAPDPKEWGRCAPWIEAALATGGGTHLLEDVHHAICAGRMQFWPGARAALVTELVTYPRLKAVRVFCGGGDLDEVLRLERRVRAWGKVNGCQRIEGFGRDGWRRALRGLGYEEPRSFMWCGL